MDGSDLDLRPHPDRVSETYAESRIREKIEMYDLEKPKTGLANVDELFREAGVPAALRLHYITAVAHLGRKSAETLEMRRRNAEMGRDRGAAGLE